MVDVMGTTLHLPPIRSLVPSLAQEMSLYSSHPLITPPPLIPIPVSHHQLIEQPQPKQQFQPQEEDHLETFSFLSPPSFPQDHTDEVVFAMLDVPSPPTMTQLPIVSLPVEDTVSSAPDDKGIVVPSSLVNASVGGSGRGGRRGRGGRASPLTVIPSSVAVPESASAAQTEANSAPAPRMPRQRRGREGRGSKAVQDAVIDGDVVKEGKSQVEPMNVEEERIKKVEVKEERKEAPVEVAVSHVNSSPMEVVDIKAFERNYLLSSSPSIDPTAPERPVVVKEEVKEPQHEGSEGEQPVAALSSASRGSRSRRPRRSTPSMGIKGIENVANATQDLSSTYSLPMPVAAAPSKTAAVSRGVAIEAAPSTQTVAVNVPSAAVTVPAAETANLVQDGATSRPQQKPQQRRQQTKPAGTAKREVVNGTRPEQAPMPQERPHAQGPPKASGNDAPRRTDGEGRERGVGGRRRMSREKGAVPTAKPPVQQSNAQNGQ